MRYVARPCMIGLIAASAAGCASLAPMQTVPLAGGAPMAQFRDGPPARVTGGFREDSCHACHFGADENDARGRIELLGLPRSYTPGETYRLELAVVSPGMHAAGFQLAFRYADDESQAGVMAVPEDQRPRVGLLHEQGVVFAHQLVDGLTLTQAEEGRWTVLWTAPESARRVLVHAAAVAADGDESQIGDLVYTLEATVEPHASASD